jgi:putative ABC transport system permease protein
LDALFRGADPGYFAAIQIPILRGRSFTNEERLDHSHVAIISQLAAKQFFPGEDPIGRHLILDKPSVPYQIVGVVGDTPYYISEEIKPIVYWPLYSGDFDAATIALRSGSSAESFAVSVQKAVTEIDHNIPVSDVLTMRQLISISTVDAGFVSMLTLIFALVALVLATVGLYGVLSYLVTQRTAEIGIRMALGAQRGKLLGLMLLEGLMPVWIGLASGLVGAGFAVQLIRSMLYGTSAFDWITFAEATIVLASVAALACIVPAWRASRLDPVLALRT